MPPVDLRHVYLAALTQSAPELLVRAHVTRDMPHDIVAIGKSAGALLDGVAAVHRVDSAFVAIPAGYRLPSVRAETHIGGHPHITPASFAAGRALAGYVDARDDILFLVSGGGSACVEIAQPPFTEDEVTQANTRLIASGRPIGEINAERRRMSAIKGGKLAARVRGHAVTLVYSDVAAGALHDVASGPTLPGTEAVLIADNATLVRAAARIIGDAAVVIEEQLEGDVADVARLLASRARELTPGQVLVAGGEPTVAVRGGGRGGRCSELAVRFALESGCQALFGSSDGVDGNSGVAGIHLPRRGKAGGTAGWQEALRNSDSYSVAVQMGEPIMIAPTGNNLRDLFLVACV
jgi:glycerate-2-kinase